ncbi:tetratricopeptide repeat protein [Microbacterium sp. LRZ72]|uniref:tetratricopeptide repeat protein n=1 Tax=Microbacterium sp. LRZ72 TaxID=2942481 RepID=UPI0029AD40E8|nr:tetratricopeptide repeat protein [Microbacterium sp. LRZ72]MDX2377253.1 tetratricopeptide repeat protein [Microbacterium sp. LRZ72]
MVAVAVPLLVPRGTAPMDPDAAASSAGDAAPSSAGSPAGILADAVAADPGDAVLRTRLAESYADAGRDAEALEEWAAAYRLAPSSSHAAQEYAAALVKAGRTDEAIAILQRENARVPDEPGTLLLLGTLLVQNDRPEGADLLARYLELTPDSPLRDEVREAIEGVAR